MTADAGPGADRAGAADPSTNDGGTDSPVLLYDGVCPLCNAFARLVARFDGAGRFRFAPLQSDPGRSLLRRHGLSADDPGTVVLIEGDDHYTRSTAALRVCRQLDGPWPLLYPLALLPESIRDRVYDVVAANRYRVFGRRDACPVPDPELADRVRERSLDDA
jgi:predicted DCC family thiol-disulfide oxidoreductase YuxK